MSEEQAKYKIKSEDNFKTRLYKEEEEVRDKILKLNRFILSDAFKAVSTTQSKLLIKQLSAMKLYHKCLSERIMNIEDVERREKIKDELR